MDRERRTGGCLCGAVRISTEGPLRGVIYCHCRQCRRQSGHYVAATSAPDAKLQVEGGENISWYAASAFGRRGFCRVCGSLMFWKAEGEGNTSIFAGVFDDPAGLESAYHIFVGSKGDYYEIADGLPQYETAPPDLAVDNRG